MSVRQQALLLQAVGLLLAIFVVPGLVRGWAKEARSFLPGGEIADQALGRGPALTDLERKAQAEEAFLAYYMVESRRSAVDNPDVKLGRWRDTACGHYFVDVKEQERRIGSVPRERSPHRSHARRLPGRPSGGGHRVHTAPPCGGTGVSEPSAS